MAAGGGGSIAMGTFEAQGKLPYREGCWGKDREADEQGGFGAEASRKGTVVTAGACLSQVSWLQKKVAVAGSIWKRSPILQ